MVTDWGKVAVAVVAIVFGIVLALTGDTTSGVSIVTLVIGYTMGNGRLIVKNQQPQPMIGRSPPDTPTPTP